MIAKGLINPAKPPFNEYENPIHMLESHLRKYKLVPLYVQAEEALAKKDNNALVQLLGVSGDSTIGFDYTYDLTNMQVADTTKILLNAHSTSSLYLG